MSELKRCKDCKEIKVLEKSFSKVRQNVDGRNHQCKDCQNKKGAQRTKAIRDKTDRYRVQ